MFSGVILLSSVSLFAGPVGDVTKTGTSTGQRKRDQLWGISPLTDNNGKSGVGLTFVPMFILVSFILFRVLRSHRGHPASTNCNHS